MHRCAQATFVLATTLCVLGAAPSWRAARAQDTVPPRPRPPGSDSLARRDSALKRDSAFKRDSASTRDSPARRSSARAASAADSRKRSAAPDTAPGWPVHGPDPLPGSILPEHRIVAFYGNPLSRRMGILGALQPDSMLARLDREVAAWTAADTSTPVQPALHLIAVVAQGSPVRDGKYRQRADTALIERVYGWAQRRSALLFLDVQLGRSTLKEELPRLLPFLKRPDVHLGLDPEFAMGPKGIPGTRVGTLDAREVNEAIDLLAELVTANSLPPKVLVVHR